MQIPSWGIVAAQPHEFLIHIRGGRIRKSGHAASCFKLPGDSVALISTAIAKLSFIADQVTREKTGVQVTGLAVYRIVDPELAHRMLDLDRMTLTEILRDMFVGATRRIVAGLTLEDCLTHRKERVATALMQEITPVLAGQGAADDATAMGWGVVVDTIEIQDVRVLSEEVFARLQAPFREELALAALVAEDRVLRERERREAERARAVEGSRRALLEEEKLRVDTEMQREVEREAHRQGLADRAALASLEREHREAEALRERTTLELATQRDRDDLALETERRRRTELPDLSPARLQEALQAETLPELARAFRGSFDKITVAPREGALFEFLTEGLDTAFRAARRHSSG